jgi:hypothetical protein
LGQVPPNVAGTVGHFGTFGLEVKSSNRLAMLNPSAINP